MHLREIDPIHDSSWLALVERHPRASVFHTPGWLEALRRTYGYEPFALTTSPPGQEITNGVVFCRVSSWLTGHRLVSLPFSDHCEPLVEEGAEFAYLLAELRKEWKDNGCKYVEFRARESDLSASPDLRKSGTFCLHRLDLRPSLDALFKGLHKDCVRRKIRRAEQDGLVYEEGRSELILERFYGLLVLARRRQLLPPQPVDWFRNLISCMGDRLKIHLASKDGRPVASIVTLRHKNVLVYKYGCSAPRFNYLGGTQLLFWKAIQEAKSSGLQELDMGRSDWNNLGLIRFKDRWGAARSNLTYWRYGAAGANRESLAGKSPIAGWLVRHVPKGLLTATGVLLYKHIG